MDNVEKILAIADSAIILMITVLAGVLVAVLPTIPLKVIATLLLAVCSFKFVYSIKYGWGRRMPPEDHLLVKLGISTEITKYASDFLLDYADEIRAEAAEKCAEKAVQFHLDKGCYGPDDLRAAILGTEPAQEES